LPKDEPLPPSSAEAERKVLGTVLLSPDVMADLIGELRAEDFFFAEHGIIYGAMADLLIEGHPISVATVATQAGKKLEGGQATVAACIEGALPGEAHMWAEQVVTYRKRRDLQKAAQLGLTLADSEADIDESFARVQTALTSAQRDSSSGVLSAGDAMDEVLGNIDRYIDDPTALAGPSTGWNGLDRLLDGYRPGGVTAIYAKTSSYKSTFVANSAHHLALNDVPVMLFTTETPTREIMERLLQIELMVNFRTLKYERRLYQIQSQIRDAAEIVRQYPIWICDQSAMDIGYVMGAVARQSTRRKLAVVVIDLIDHVSSKFLTRSETESERYVSQQVKAMAKREELHVVETTHVKKADRFVLGANRPYIDPEEVKGSTSKIQDADASISLMVVKETDTGYAPMERDEIVRQRHEEGQHLIYAAVTKNRHGEQGNVLFNVDLTRGGIMSEL